MKLGLDLYNFSPEYPGGVSTFSLGLAEGLVSSMGSNGSIIIFSSATNDAYLRAFFSCRDVKIIRLHISPIARYINRSIVYLSWFLKKYNLRYSFDNLFRRGQMKKIDEVIDALIIPTTTLNFYALYKPTILCIHDIQQEYHPYYFSYHQRILRWSSYRLSAARASCVQVSSKYIRECLLEKFTFIPETKFLLAPEGVDVKKFSQNGAAQRPVALPDIEKDLFIFYPAQIRKHKNHILLMHALAEFKNQIGFELNCVLTGVDSGHWKNVESICKKLGLDNVFYLGRVDFHELLWLYEHTAAVLALGEHESSSLPIREGASFGKPLICSDIPPNIEASGALELNMFDKNSYESLADLLIRVIQNYEEFDARAKTNKETVANFSWDKIAQLYISQAASLVNENNNNYH